MGLTQQQELHLRDPDHFPAWQLFILGEFRHSDPFGHNTNKQTAIVRLAEPIAITSILPYAWRFVLHFHVGTRDDAAFWTGVLIAAFSFAEALTSVFWGSLSDRVGRRKVLISGCFGTCASLLIVGFASNFWIALAGRVVGGLLNGNIGVIQTMVGELVTNPKHEPKAYAIMPFVWSLGTILGPMIGGLLSEPAENFPGSFSRTGIFGKFPFLLPNLVCAGTLACSITIAHFFLHETHPGMQPWVVPQQIHHVDAETPLCPASGSFDNAPANLSAESYGTFDSVTITEERRRSNASTSRSASPGAHKVFTRNVVMLTAALGIFTYHSMTFDTLMPIFFQDARQEPSSELSGGLGLSTKDVGIIMSVNGLIALFMQGIVFPYMASWLGVWRLTVFVTVGHPLAYFVMPFLIQVPVDWIHTGIYGALSLRNFFAILVYPLLLILIKEAAPISHLGKINGLAASAGGVARMMASPISGYLYGVGSRVHFTPVAWWASALIAAVGAIQIFFVDRMKNKTAHVRTVAAWAEEYEHLDESEDDYKDDDEEEERRSRQRGGRCEA